MSTTNAPPQPPQPPPAPRPAPEADPYAPVIEQRIAETRSQVRWLDVAVGLLTLLLGMLVYLLLAAVVDQWIVPGGLGFGGRIAALLVMLAAAGYYFAVRVLPPLVRKINPVFAAHTIERSQPLLKNSLVNFLLLRSSRGGVAPVVYRAMEQRAAADLSQVSLETAVDRGPVIRLSYALAVIVAVGALYLVLSPKSPLVSAARVLWPWADIAAPTRVKIDDVEPGDAVVFHGDQVEVSAEVRDLAGDEPVLLYFTTADGQSVDQAVPMTLSEGGYRHRCTIPPGSAGLQQDAEYRLVAGDCRTRSFNIQVQVAPTIVVESLEYDYPDYTQIPNRTIRGQADIEAIEGTTVKLAAKANLPIEWAQIDLDCDGRGSLRMRAEEDRAYGKFKLRMSASDPGQPEHDCYQLLFSDPQQRKSVRPTRHRIEVIPDLPPRVKLVDPPQDMARVPVNGVLELKVEAEDPDFALRRVRLRAEREGRSLMIPALLDLPKPEEPHEGPFEATYRFEPAKLGLEPGDKVLYRAEAQDNKEPIFNLAYTDRRWLVIVGKDDSAQEQGAEGAGQGQPQAGQNGKPGQQNQGEGAPPEQGERPPQPDDPNAERQPQQPPEGQQGEGQQGQGEAQPNAEAPPQDQPQDGSPQAGQGQQKQGQGEQGQPQPDGGQNSESQPRPPIDGQTNPGDAFEEILEHREQQREEQQSNQPQEPGESQSKQPPEQQQGQQPQPNQQQDQNQPQQGQQQPGHQQGQQPQDQQQEGQQQPQPGGESKPEQGQQQDGQQQPGDQQMNEGTPDQEMPGQQAPEAGAPTAEQPPQDSPNEQSGGGQSGQQTPGQQAPEQGGDSATEDQQGSPDGAGQPSAPKGGPQKPDSGQQPSDAAQPTEGNQPGGTQNRQPGETSSGKQQTEKTTSGEPAGQQRAPDNQPGASETSPSSGNQPPGEGDRGRSQGEPQKDGAQAADQQGMREAKGGDPQDHKGQAGDGQPSAKDSGSPSPQEKNQQRGKQADNPDAAQQGREESADSPSISPKDSDSQGDTAGDRSGGGQKGGGQRSNQSGTGSAGQNTAAEQGGSQSQQKGEGETGSKPGDQVEADRPTGQSGDRKGPGSRQQKSGDRPSPEKPSSGDGAKQPPRQPGEQPPTPESGGQPASQQQSPSEARPGSGNPTTGGQRSGRNPSGELPPMPEEEPGGEAANREYAEKSTKLALEYLEDELAKDEPDAELLDRLGWNRRQLAEFTRRWKKMLADAERAGPQGEQGRARLDDALKSLGLRPRGTQLQGGRTRSDRMKRLMESPQFDPPPGWKEHFEAYSRGISRGGSGGN